MRLMIVKLRRGDDVRIDNDNDRNHDDKTRCPFLFFNVFMTTHVCQIGDEILSLMAPSAGELWDDRTEWRQGGRRGGLGQDAGVLWVHISHARRDVRTYSALIHRVVKSRLLCHVVVRWRGRRHSDSLSLQPAAGEERETTSWRNKCLNVRCNKSRF